MSISSATFCVDQQLILTSVYTLHSTEFEWDRLYTSSEFAFCEAMASFTANAKFSLADQALAPSLVFQTYPVKRTWHSQSSLRRIGRPSLWGLLWQTQFSGILRISWLPLLDCIQAVWLQRSLFDWSVHICYILGQFHPPSCHPLLLQVSKNFLRYRRQSKREEGGRSGPRLWWHSDSSLSQAILWEHKVDIVSHQGECFKCEKYWAILMDISTDTVMLHISLSHC